MQLLVIHCLQNVPFYRGKDCMKNYCIDLRKHATKIIIYEKSGNDTINKCRKKVTS